MVSVLKSYKICISFIFRKMKCLSILLGLLVLVMSIGANWPPPFIPTKSKNPRPFFPVPPAKPIPGFR